MGGGKGSPDHYVAVIKPGTILFEMGGVTSRFCQDCYGFGRIQARCAH